MKAIRNLLALMLFGTVFGVVAESDAIARPRHPVSADTGQASKPTNIQQKSNNGPSDLKGSNHGAASNSAANRNVGTSSADKGSNQNASGPAPDGPMKKGPGLPGKSGPPNASQGPKGDVGKSQIGDRGDGYRGVVHPGTSPGADAIRTDNVIVDRPNHKVKKPVVDTTKKTTTTIFRPAKKDRPNQTAITTIGGGEKNAIGLAVQKDRADSKDLKSNADPKADTKGAGQGTLVDTKSATAVVPNIVHPTVNVNAATVSPKTATGLNGSLISHPANNPGTIGGAAKNMASINGTSFRPKRGR
jgi:hypothetical protein